MTQTYERLNVNSSDCNEDPSTGMLKQWCHYLTSFVFSSKKQESQDVWMHGVWAVSPHQSLALIWLDMVFKMSKMSY